MGEDITQADTHRIMRKGIAISPEGRRVFPDLTVSENLKMGGFFLNRSEIEEGEDAAIIGPDLVAVFLAGAAVAAASVAATVPTVSVFAATRSAPATMRLASATDVRSSIAGKYSA